MLVIHGAWTADGPAVWAEDTRAVPRAGARRGRRRAASPHPFAASVESLAAALTASPEGTPTGLVLVLPTRAGRPCASPEIPQLSDPATARPRTAAVTAVPWLVPALTVRGPTIEIVTSPLPDAVPAPHGGEPDGDEPAGGGRTGDGPAGDEMVPAADWRFLGELARFADDLARRGRVLPTVVPGPSGSGRATWRPLFTREDAAWVRALATAAPPSFAAVRVDPPDAGRADDARGRADAGGVDDARGRADGDGDGDGDGMGFPRDVVARALDHLVDVAVRRRLGEPPLGTTDRRTAAGPAPRRGSAAVKGSGPVKGSAATALAWSRALFGEDGAFEATNGQFRQLASDVHGWQRGALGLPARARFRLVEPMDGAATDGLGPPTPQAPPNPPDQAAPPEPADPEAQELTAAWRLEFALQATREPSVVATAEDLWSGGPAALALTRYVPAPQQALLAELGRAQRLVPEVARALRTARPCAVELDTVTALEFLRHGASTLSAAGFGVDLPGWAAGRAVRLGARLTATGQPGTVAGSAGLGQDTLLDFRWEIALGDTAVTAEELAVLARAGQPLVRVRGQWVEIDARVLRRALAGLERAGSGQGRVADLFAALGADASGPAGLPVVDVRAEGWIGDLLSGSAERRVVPVDPPGGFTGRLRPYQARGLAWLTFLDRLGLGAVLADDMGLGKTVQLLALIAADADRAHAGPAGPADDAGPAACSDTAGEAGGVGAATTGATLLVCPMSLVGNWQREAARFTPELRVHVHHGSDRARGEEFVEAVTAADLVITTYALAARDDDHLRAVRWRRVVLDEAQAVKNAATNQARAVRALPAAHRVAVTGTPVENRLADLWSIMEFANPGVLGTATAFRDRYAVPIERHGDDAVAERLRRITQPFVLRRLKTDRSIITDLPEKLEMEVVCSLTTEQAALYRAVVDDMLERIENSEGIERRGLVLATMTKLKQVCNHPAQFLRDGSRLAGRSGKLARVEETVEELLGAGEKALLFTQFADFGQILRAHLTARFGREVAFLHGGVAKAERDATVERFNGDDATAPSLFVLSLKAGGTGLNLTSANHVIHVDRWWNPAVEDQATDRAFRIGQHRTVQVRKLVCAGTIEERISAMIGEKRGLAAKIVGTGEGWLTELSTDDLRDLLRLDSSAVTE